MVFRTEFHVGRVVWQKQVVQVVLKPSAPQFYQSLLLCPEVKEAHGVACHFLLFLWTHRVPYQCVADFALRALHVYTHRAVCHGTGNGFGAMAQVEVYVWIFQ